MPLGKSSAYEAGAHELGLASTAIVVQLIKRLIAQDTLTRDAAKEILKAATDELAASYSKPTYTQAAKLIADEVARKI